MTSMLPNEQLARTPELFARIITDISEMKNLKNVELTCRAFYELSSQNYKPTIDLYPFASKSLGSKQINGIYFRNGQTKMTFASICVNSNHIKKDLYIRALGKQMKKTTDLVVVGMDSEATEIMLRANCFQNVKKLTLSMMQLNEYSLKIFELSTMNPEILCLDYCQAMFISETENDLSHHVPQSLKHLIIASALISIDPFIKKLLNKFGSKFLELAEFKPEAMHCINSRNELACLSRILSLTKEANIMVSNESLRNFPALKQVLEEEANCSNLTMIIETSVERTFFELLRCESFDQTLKSLKIVSNSENHEYHKLTNIQKTYIYDSIKNLEHLTHITITGFLVSVEYNLNDSQRQNDIHSYGEVRDNFKLLFSSFTPNLTSLHITKASFIELQDLEILSQRCPKLEILIIESIESYFITLDKVINMFPNLTIFDVGINDRDTGKANYDCICDVSDTTNVKIKWPPIKYVRFRHLQQDGDLYCRYQQIAFTTPYKNDAFLLYQNIHTLKFDVIFTSNMNLLEETHKIISK